MNKKVKAILDFADFLMLNVSIYRGMQRNYMEPNEKFDKILLSEFDKLQKQVRVEPEVVVKLAEIKIGDYTLAVDKTNNSHLWVVKCSSGEGTSIDIEKLWRMH